MQFKSTGEAASLLIGSIVWQYVDIYWTMLVFTLSLSKNPPITETAFIKDVQWMAETLYLEGKIYFFESCTQPTIGNAKSALLELGVLTKTNVYLNLSEKYTQAGEQLLVKLIERVSQFKMQEDAQALLAPE